MQAYIESLIQFGSMRSKLLMSLNRALSICGWTVLSLNLPVYSLNCDGHYTQE